MKNLLLIILFLLISIAESIASDKITEKEHFKYWYYRNRLINQFVVIGEAEEFCVPSGLSIPAKSANQWNIGDSSLCLEWNANPVQGLGWYIGVLATELKLLYLYNQPYQVTQQELFYAMKAYERLDKNCECLLYPLNPKESQGLINGLYMRDDVGYEFFNEHSTFRDSNHYAGFGSTYKKYSPSNRPDTMQCYPSGDEMTGVLAGFALLVNSLADCPAEVVIYNGYRFIDEAIMHTARYMDRLVEDNWFGKLTNGDTYTFGHSLLFDMNGYGLAKSADYIRSPFRNYTVPLSITLPPAYSQHFPYHVPSLLDLFVYFPTLPFTAPFILPKLFDGSLPTELLESYQQFGWQLRMDPESEFLGNEQIGIHLFQLMVLDQPYYGICAPPIPPLNPIRMCFDAEEGNIWYATSGYMYSAIGNSIKDMDDNNNDITYEALLLYTQAPEWEFMPLLNLYLYDKDKDADQLRGRMISHLKTAPCQGPHYLPYGETLITCNYTASEGVAGWRGGFKWNSEPSKAQNGIDNSRVGIYAPGLDYMIAYNLFWLECLQKDLQSPYIEMLSYTNGRDKYLRYWDGSQTYVYFNYDNTILDNINNGTDVKIIGESITLTGDIDFSTAHPVILTTYPKLDYCDIEDMMNQ